ncbi:hypothetical protein BKA56DRAFT_354116 [Ilyonectria sp. MPI-CAGE-AT-0026]|nr:hypothetical protein BKA56DRAFT_354116 [Ilyonectria sp. MPI-CAGE-AT-0026]
MGFGSGRGYARNSLTQTAASAHPMSITMVRYGYRVVRPHVRKKGASEPRPGGTRCESHPFHCGVGGVGVEPNPNCKMRLIRGETEACTVPGLPGMAPPRVARRHRRQSPVILAHVCFALSGRVANAAREPVLDPNRCGAKTERILCYCGHADAVDGGEGVRDCGVMTGPTHAAIVMGWNDCSEAIQVEEASEAHHGRQSKASPNWPPV